MCFILGEKSIRWPWRAMQWLVVKGATRSTRLFAELLETLQVWAEMACAVDIGSNELAPSLHQVFLPAASSLLLPRCFRPAASDV